MSTLPLGSQFVQKALLRLPPEAAHHAGIRLLKTWFWKEQLRGVQWKSAPAIQIKNLPSLPFANRVGLAAGFDKNAEVFPALAALGFGFIEVGTVTPLPQSGNPKPRIWRIPPLALRNALGFNNVGVERFRSHLIHARKKGPRIPLFANLGKGKKTPESEAVEDYRLLARQLGDLVDGFVINVSSPNTPGLRDLQSEQFLEDLAGALPSEKPVLVKVAPDLENSQLGELARYVKQSNFFSGMVVCNTSVSLSKSYFGQKAVGGVSGDPLFPRSLECVSVARENLGGEKVLIGVGGITSAERARQMRGAGADLVEIYTGFVYKGPGLVKAIAEAVES